MRFSAAMCEIFHRNKEVRRASWPPHTYLRKLGDSLAYEDLEDLFILNSSAFEATDWEVYEPKPKKRDE